MPTPKTFHWLALTAPDFAQVLFQSCPEGRDGSHAANYVNPRQLWVQGTEKAMTLIARIPRESLAIVGTRIPERKSLHHLEVCLKELSELARPILVSGMARGTDSHAHALALKYGFPTVAVLAGSIDDPYPRETFPVRQKILENDGLVISETPPGERPQPGRFLQRNRLIAAWSAATWVVQAHPESGALNTAGWARKAGRDLYATPCFPGDSTFGGNEALLKFRDAPATAIYNGLGFEKTWIGLGGIKKIHDPEADRLREEKELATDSEMLLKRITETTSEKTGIEDREPEAGHGHFENLLNWSIESGLTPERFFRAIQRLTQDRQIIEYKGALLKNLTPSE